MRGPSAAFQRATKKLAGLKSIQPEPDLGSELTIENLDKKLDTIQTKTASFNQRISELDALANELDALDSDLRQLDSRFLSAVAGRFGRDSSEYEAVGGTRTSERKKRERKTDPKTPSGL